MQPSIENIEKLLAKKNLHWWMKVQMWPDILNIEMNDMKPNV